jgi:putative glutamine amidotransferase
MDKIKIGLLGSHDEEGRMCIMPAYLNALWTQGAVGTLLPYRTDETFIAEAVEYFDGFMLCGGDDIDPTLYGEQNLGLSKNVCSSRDRFERALFPAAYAADKAILGICRGEQIINVAMGGSLYQHIDNHLQSAPKNERLQKTRIENGSLLHKIIGKDEILVNSFHHQNINKLGEGLVCNAMSEDGYIEAVHAPEKRFCLAVQWHPEISAHTDEDSNKIFEAFVKACRN